MFDHNRFQWNCDAIRKYQPNLAEALVHCDAARELNLIHLDNSIPSGDAVLVAGLPPDSGMNALVSSRQRYLILIPPGVAELKTYLGLTDLSTYIRSGRLVFAPGPEGALQALNDLFTTLYARSLIVYGAEGSDEYRRVVREMEFFNRLCRSSRVTL